MAIHVPAASRNNREAILAAARAEMAEQGYDLPSIRSIARRACVDPRLVRYHFGSKDALFLDAFQPHHPPADLGERLPKDDGLAAAHILAREFLGVWRANSEAMQALALCAATHPPAAELISGELLRDKLEPLLRQLDPDLPRERAALTMSLFLGVVLIDGLRASKDNSCASPWDGDTAAAALGNGLYWAIYGTHPEPAGDVRTG